MRGIGSCVFWGDHERGGGPEAAWSDREMVLDIFPSDTPVA